MNSIGLKYNSLYSQLQSSLNNDDVIEFPNHGLILFRKATKDAVHCLIYNEFEQ